MGSGILGLAYAMANTGIVLFLWVITPRPCVFTDGCIARWVGSWMNRQPRAWMRKHKMFSPTPNAGFTPIVRLFETQVQVSFITVSFICTHVQPCHASMFIMIRCYWLWSWSFDAAQPAHYYFIALSEQMRLQPFIEHSFWWAIVKCSQEDSDNSVGSVKTGEGSSWNCHNLAIVLESLSSSKGSWRFLIHIGIVSIAPQKSSELQLSSSYSSDIL